MSPSVVLTSLRAAAADAPIVVAHRGDSANHPENTVPAFAAARALGVVMQEFDVQQTRDGVLVCMHDESLDRTTDAARRLGPGALVAQATWRELERLDAGSWRGPAHAGARVPSLADALAAMRPACVPMIEHKGGRASVFVDELRRLDALGACVLQSFDWGFVAAAHALAPDLALAVLGPTPQHARADAAAIDAARACGAGILHWRDRELGREDVARCHAAGLLVCTYTTDDELGWAGGAQLGFDAMCTNVPARATGWRETLRRAPPGRPA
jgi:glycerophosphoryl diester phosphodiesterase